MTTAVTNSGAAPSGVETFDVAIIGGGLVGASLACALANSHLRIALVEEVAFSAPSQPSFDDRSIALSYGSRRILAGLDLWSPIAGAANPITKIHISNRGRFGMARITASELRVDALGYVVESRVMGAVFHTILARIPNLSIYAPARLAGVETSASSVRLTIADDAGTRQIAARLAVAADGSNSFVRRYLGMDAEVRGYEQTAIVANVQTEFPHNNVAYERFTDTGPLALLPLTGQRLALVWTVSPDRVDGLLAAADQDFLSQLQDAFGYRLGKFTRVGRRSAYPLQLVRATDAAKGRVLLIGNAAHSLHPVAGQGFNLGLRDVAALAEVLVRQAAAEADVGGSTVFDAYRQWRLQDQDRITLFTDVLARIFANPFPPVVWGRNLGLLAVDLLPPLKRRLALTTMGLRDPLPRLGRGLGLAPIEQ